MKIRTEENSAKKLKAGEKKKCKIIFDKFSLSKREKPEFWIGTMAYD